MADGEMAIPKDFADSLRARRIEKRLSQTELARRVRCTQGAISLIENGISGSSQKLLAICRVLEIDPPSFLVHDDDAQWLRIGQALRRSDPARFKAVLQTISSLVDVPSQHNPDEKPPKPKH